MRANDFFILLICFIFISGCNVKLQKTTDESGLIPAITKDEVSFALVKKYVFEPKCIQCHQQLGQMDLGNYQKVSANLNNIENDVFVRGSMPKSPAPPLNQEEKQLLQLWISAQAPELPGGGSNPRPILEANFLNIKTNIFELKCTQCHNPNGKANKVPLQSIADLTEGFSPLVEAGNPDGSYLTIVISAGSRRPMPPLDSGVERVSQEEINIIKEWIKNGAKD